MNPNIRRQLPVIQPHHRQINCAIDSAIDQQHACMLRKPSKTLAQLETNNRLFFTANEAGAFEHSCTVVSLVPESWRADPRLRIDEVGGLIAGPGRQRGGRRASATVRRAVETRREIDGDNQLFVATSRGEDSARVLEEAGLTRVSIAEFYMLFGGLSCDPECVEGPEGQPAWLGCGARALCAARGDVADGIRPDGCHGYVSDLELAWKKERMLRELFHDDASEVRAAIAEGFREEEMAGLLQ